MQVPPHQGRSDIHNDGNVENSARTVRARDSGELLCERRVHSALVICTGGNRINNHTYQGVKRCLA
jgi:hypothetical protein